MGLTRNDIMLHRFMPIDQRKLIAESAKDELLAKELEEPLTRLATVVANMPHTYQTDGQGDEAIVHLHYFMSGSDWWITEKDVIGGVIQAFGLASINGNYPELGYISIAELVETRGMQLDFHWEPINLKAVKEKHK